MKSAGKRGLFIVTGAMVVLMMGFLASAGAQEAATRGQIAGILKQLNQAVANGDLAAFENLTVPPNPQMKLTPEEFSGAKDRMLELFPPLSAIDPLHFELGPKESMVVVRFGMEDKQTVNMRAYRFTNTDQGWKLLLKFVSKTFDAQNPEADEAAIAKELATNPEFRLAKAEKKQVPDLPVPTVEGLAGQTGGGFLWVDNETYTFKEAVAYQSDAQGEKQTIVLVTETPVDVEDLKSKVKKLGIWTGFMNNVMISFDDKAKPRFFWLWVKKDNLSVSSPAMGLESHVTIQGDQITGQVLMREIGEHLGKDTFFQVAFKTNIIIP